MKPLSEQDHYEILEVARTATPDEIERAYRLTSQTYAEDSLAGYSVFDEGEASALRERMETAYRVLADEESRQEYDVSLAVAAEDPTPPVPTPLPELVAPAPAPIEPFEELDEEDGDFDGARLRRCRLRRGVELEEIAGVTKINLTYLRFIEEERFADLPAPVYVRGFVSAYAGCVGLDPRRVAASYMKRFEPARPEPRRGRFSR